MENQEQRFRENEIDDLMEYSDKIDRYTPRKGLWFLLVASLLALALAVMLVTSAEAKGRMALISNGVICNTEAEVALYIKSLPSRQGAPKGCGALLRPMFALIELTSVYEDKYVKIQIAKFVFVQKSLGTQYGYVRVKQKVASNDV